ncbi:hypothetical protein P691DRAFT_774425 [Macrolepiota fuliginosa MF-IS2]|uniref:Uncharacterized protein n=1 Tax=Macrolepiota fuliginosa MF-IS2 TaxID=1400762 RepID=A0A9P5XHC3_9AGAR|nr:hypothetical protein P691DRAFT_774425 [Macrolepiota fuliginosa MF-IS2]
MILNHRLSYTPPDVPLESFYALSAVMQPIHSIFIDSVISVKENVVKNILFRASAIAFQYAIFNFCAYAAYLTMEYTSFLMFVEDYIQRIFFITSQGMNRGAILVLVFTISYTLANMYDTLLWALDAPGYVIRSQLVNGTSISPFLIQNPSYVNIINDPKHDLDRIDVNETLTSNLFKPGFNFSFPPSSYIRKPETTTPLRLMNATDGVGPRIYVDEEGCGVSFGQQLLGWTTDGRTCPLTESSDGTLLLWYCNIPGTESTRYLQQPVGEPLVWWDDDYDKTTYVAPVRSDNPWASFSTGGDTAVMKQVFTLTKGTRRHTFLQTTLKVSMVAKNLFPEAEILSMLGKIYSNNPGLPELYTKRCLEAQADGVNSSTMGFLVQGPAEGYIGWSSTEFVNIVSENNETDRLDGLLRVLDITLELVRSETIAEPVEPLVECNLWNVNQATGGTVRWNDCYKSVATNQTNGAFLGQIDTSAVAIIVDVLGDGKNDTSAVALSDAGQNWYIFNRTWIDQLLMSRAFLLGGDAGTVNMFVHHNEPAISYLQLLLILVPFILALAAFTLMLKDKPGYYKSSLFVSLATTTHLGKKDQPCETVGYFKHPPNLVLQKSTDHVRIGTEDGAYIMSSREGYGSKHADVEEEVQILVVPERDDGSVASSSGFKESFPLSPVTATSASPLLSPGTKLNSS